MLSALKNSTFAGKYLSQIDKIKETPEENKDTKTSNKNISQESLTSRHLNQSDTSVLLKVEPKNFDKTPTHPSRLSISKRTHLEPHVRSTPLRFSNYQPSKTSPLSPHLPGPARKFLKLSTYGNRTREFSEAFISHPTDLQKPSEIEDIIISFDRGLSQHGSWLEALLILELPIDEFHLGLTYMIPALPYHLSFLCHESIHHILHDSLPIRKIRHLLLFVKSVISKGGDPIFLLSDPTGQLPGCFHRSVYEEPTFYPQAGTTLILRDVTSYRPPNSQPYLIVTEKNIVRWLPKKSVDSNLRQKIEEQHSFWSQRFNKENKSIEDPFSQADVVLTSDLTDQGHCSHKSMLSTQLTTPRDDKVSPYEGVHTLDKGFMHSYTYTSAYKDFVPMGLYASPEFSTHTQPKCMFESCMGNDPRGLRGTSNRLEILRDDSPSEMCTPIGHSTHTVGLPSDADVGHNGVDLSLMDDTFMEKNFTHIMSKNDQDRGMGRNDSDDSPTIYTQRVYGHRDPTHTGSSPEKSKLDPYTFEVISKHTPPVENTHISNTQNKIASTGHTPREYPDYENTHMEYTHIEKKPKEYTGKKYTPRNNFQAQEIIKAVNNGQFVCKDQINHSLDSLLEIMDQEFPSQI